MCLNLFNKYYLNSKVGDYVLKEMNTINEWVQFVGKDNLQAFQDSFSLAFGVSLCLLNKDGETLTVWSNYPLFCDLVAKENRDRCLYEEKTLRTKVIKSKKIEMKKCYMGLTIFLVPIFFADEIIALAYGSGLILDEHKVNHNKFDIQHISQDKFRNMLNLLSSSLNLIAEKSFIKRSVEVNSSTENLFFLKSNLSLREIEIVDLINRGYSNKEIANELNISDKTVKTHITNVLKKLNLRNRMQIMILCKEKQSNL